MSLSARRHRQLLGARERVRRAQEALAEAVAGLDAQYARVRRAVGGTDSGPLGFLDPDDLARVVEIEDAIDRILSGAGRFHRHLPRQAAKDLLSLELADRLLLARLGFSSRDAFDESRAASGHERTEIIDLAYVEFARFDLESAAEDLDVIEHQEFGLQRWVPGTASGSVPD